LLKKASLAWEKIWHRISFILRESENSNNCSNSIFISSGDSFLCFFFVFAQKFAYYILCTCIKKELIGLKTALKKKSGVDCNLRLISSIYITVTSFFLCFFLNCCYCISYSKMTQSSFFRLTHLTGEKKTL